MRRFVVLGSVVALLLAGCGNSPAPVPKSPDQALFDLHTLYDAGLTVVVNYGKQPLCPGNTWTSSKGLCANGPLLIAANTASDKAAAALALADPAVAAWKASKSSSAEAAAIGMITAAAQEVGAVLAFKATIQSH